MPVPSSLLRYGKMKRNHHNSTFEIVTNDFCKSQSFPQVESSRTSLRTHFEVLGLESEMFGLDASSPRKLLCSRLQDSIIFGNVKNFVDRLKNFFEDRFFLEIAEKCKCG